VNFFESLEHPWKIAFEEAWIAYCAGSFPIGAVIMRGTEVIARGRNQIFEPHALTKTIAGTQISYAELNALVQLPQEFDVSNLELYSTMEPCPLCTGAIRMTHIPTVFYAARDPHAGSTNLFTEHRYMARGKIRAIAPTNVKLELISMALLMCANFEEVGHDALGGFQNAFAQIVPASVPLAQILFQQNVLRKPAEDQASVAQVFDLILTKLEDKL
jgi:tRNA(adenine34) deaminase